MAKKPELPVINYGYIAILFANLEDHADRLYNTKDYGEDAFENMAAFAELLTDFFQSQYDLLYPGARINLQYSLAHLIKEKDIDWMVRIINDAYTHFDTPGNPEPLFLALYEFLFGPELIDIPDYIREDHKATVQLLPRHKHPWPVRLREFLGIPL